MPFDSPMISDLLSAPTKVANALRLVSNGIARISATAIAAKASLILCSPGIFSVISPAYLHHDKPLPEFSIHKTEFQKPGILLRMISFQM